MASLRKRERAKACVLPQMRRKGMGIRAMMMSSLMWKGDTGVLGDFLCLQMISAFVRHLDMLFGLYMYGARMELFCHLELQLG